MESEEQAERDEHNVTKVPATLGLMIGFFVVVAVVGIILVLVL